MLEKDKINELVAEKYRLCKKKTFNRKLFLTLACFHFKSSFKSSNFENLISLEEIALCLNVISGNDPPREIKCRKNFSRWQILLVPRLANQISIHQEETVKARLLYDNSSLRAIRLSKVAFRGLGFAKRVPLQDRRKTDERPSARSRMRAYVRGTGKSIPHTAPAAFWVACFSRRDGAVGSWSTEINPSNNSPYSEIYTILKISNECMSSRLPEIFSIYNIIGG